MTLSSFAAVIKTESDKTVVVATLESLEDLFKAMIVISFPMKEDTLDSLMLAIQDTLENKVSMERTLCTVSTAVDSLQSKYLAWLAVNSL